MTGPHVCISSCQQYEILDKLRKLTTWSQWFCYRKTIETTTFPSGEGGVSPVELLKLRSRQQQRASSTKAIKSPAKQWQWRDKQ
jgi:hypothetical protein